MIDSKTSIAVAPELCQMCTSLPQLIASRTNYRFQSFATTLTSTFSAQRASYGSEPFAKTLQTYLLHLIYRRIQTPICTHLVHCNVRSNIATRALNTEPSKSSLWQTSLNQQVEHASSLFIRPSAYRLSLANRRCRAVARNSRPRSASPALSPIEKRVGADFTYLQNLELAHRVGEIGPTKRQRR